MPNKTGEYKWRVSISSDTGERLSKDLGDKNYGTGAGIERMGSRKTFASVSTGFDTAEEYSKDMEALNSQEFLDALEMHRATTQSICKFAFKNDLMITIEMPENPYKPKETNAPSENPLVQPPPEQAQGQTTGATVEEGEFATVETFLISVNFKESDQKKPKHIKEKYFRSILDDNGKNTGYVNAEQTKDGWKLSRWIRATGESIPFDLQWPEEYLEIVRGIDEIVAKQKMGF